VIVERPSRGGRARLAVLAALVAVMTVTACATSRRPAGAPSEPGAPTVETAPAVPPPLEPNALIGDWGRAIPLEGIQGLRLEEAGALTIVGTSPTRGVRWRAEGRALLLSMENPGVGAWQLAVPVEDATASRLRLGGPSPAFSGEWRRATFTTVRGTVTYRQREALTPEASVFVDLRDAGAPPETPPLARARVLTPGQVPIPFALIYDPASLDPSRSYALSARISDRGELRFVTERPVPVPTAGDAPPVEIVVGPIR